MEDRDEAREVSRVQVTKGLECHAKEPGPFFFFFSDDANGLF